MLEDFYYRRKTVVNFDAAVVGISRVRWQSVTAEEAKNVERVRAIMEAHQFDVLPVDEPGKDVRSYVMTKRWGDYSAVQHHEIEFDDVIPQQTPLYDVIRQLAEHQRQHFFLAHEDAITGLITVVNLNCRQARTFLFSLLCDLEIRLGQLIQGRIGSDLTADEVLAESKDDVRK